MKLLSHLPDEILKHIARHFTLAEWARGPHQSSLSSSYYAAPHLSITHISILEPTLLLQGLCMPLPESCPPLACLSVNVLHSRTQKQQAAPERFQPRQCTAAT